MSKKIDSIHSFLSRYRKSLYYTIPILAILILACASNFFYIDKKVVNQRSLWDMAGRPYETFLYELNLPNSVGAVFVAGTPDNLEKTEKYYKKVNIGDIFTSQLRSLFGKKITAFSISAYINFIFGIFAVVFSILVGYFIFRNGYISIPVFLLIVIFRNYSQGLIYGLPLRHAYAVFNPLIAFSIIIFLIMFLKDSGKKYWLALGLSGFATAYIAHCRTSEGKIIIASLTVFAILMLIEYLRIRQKDYRKTLVGIAIVFIAMYAGYSGYYKMVTAFEYHRDKKLNFQTTGEKVLAEQPAFHSLYTSLFRYGVPNKYGDKIGYDAVYARHPDIQKKFSADINYIELANSSEYNGAIKELYFEFIFHKPEFLAYLTRSVYDYILFLPYYTWTGDKSAHAYLPKINKNVEIEPQDLAPDFKDTSLNWILNLKPKYLPEGPLFWLYFICAYAVFIQAVYTSFVQFKKGSNPDVPFDELIENKMPIYLLWGMLIYFFFASVVRILIPVHGQGAVVAFNIIIIYNLVRITASMGIIEPQKLKIPPIRMQAWLLLLIMVLLPSLTIKGMDLFSSSKGNLIANGGFERNLTGWIPYRTNVYLFEGGQAGNCLKSVATEDATGYVYFAVPTESGRKYEISAYFKSGTAVNGQIKVGTMPNVEDLYYPGVLSNAEWKRHSGVFSATAPITYITLVNLTSVKGQTSFFDGVSLIEVE